MKSVKWVVEAVREKKKFWHRPIRGKPLIGGVDVD